MGQVCIQAGTFELGVVWMSTTIVAVDSTVIPRVVRIPLTRSSQ